MKDVKAFIFDLDGVIVFTDNVHYQAWKKMADELGVYFDEQINNRLRGVSRMESLDIILERYDGPALSQVRKAELAEGKNNIYQELLKTMMPSDVAEEVRDTLKELHKREYKLAIGSSSKNARLILEKVKMLPYFDAISDGNNIGNSKPDPEVFLKAAEYLGVKPEECIVIEDANAGIDAAKAGGMYAAAMGDAVNHGKADVVLHTFSDLLNI